VKAPGVTPRVESKLALNIDLTAMFYDLAKDPGEMNNIAGNTIHSAAKAGLATALEAEKAAVAS
jgi:hypothetical protein